MHDDEFLSRQRQCTVCGEVVPNAFLKSEMGTDWKETCKCAICRRNALNDLAEKQERWMNLNDEYMAAVNEVDKKRYEMNNLSREVEGNEGSDRN